MSGRGEQHLESMEHEAHEQQEKSDELNEEVERHKDQVKKLEEAIHELHSQSKELKSDQLTAAIGHAEIARREAQEKVAQALEERDRLLVKNAEMTAHVDKAFNERKKVENKINILQFGAKGEVAQALKSAMDSIHQDMNTLALVSQDLKEARSRLEKISG
jgi:chromosome segregation ATPase